MIALDNSADAGKALKRIQMQFAAETYRIIDHAHQEMVEENVSIEELLDAVATSMLLEYYPDHRRGSCCLLCGHTHRPLHVVCTTNHDPLIIITVYEPRPPKWVTPAQRRPKS